MSSSGVLPKTERLISFDLHTVQGAWTIVLTVILAVFAVLLLLRLLAPVAPRILTDDEELEELSAALLDRAEV